MLPARYDDDDDILSIVDIFCLHILEALYIRTVQPKLNRINFETRANVLKCL